MLDNLEIYARKKNDLYDGNPNSYDMMILLSLEPENLGMPENGDWSSLLLIIVFGGGSQFFNEYIENLQDGMLGQGTVLMRWVMSLAPITTGR